MHKVYVSVTAEFTPEGEILPRSFIWEDGTSFDVDRILDVRPAPSLKVGGQGDRYTIRVKGKETFIWFDACERKWFMEGK